MGLLAKKPMLFFYNILTEMSAQMSITVENGYFAKT